MTVMAASLIIMVEWLVVTKKIRYYLPSFLVLFFTLFATSYFQANAVQISKDSLVLNLREIAWDRLEKKHAELKTSLASVKVRRNTTYILGAAAVVGGLGWLLYRFINPASEVNANGKLPRQIDTQTKFDSGKNKIDEAFFKDFEESRTVSGRIKQGVAIGLSAAAVSVIIKRFGYIWDKASVAPMNILTRFWGNDSNQVLNQYAERFISEVALMQEALQRFESGIALVLKSGNDQQLKLLTCEDLQIAWEGLMAAFEDFSAIIAIVAKAKDPIEIFVSDRAIKNIMQVFGGIVQWADGMLMVDTVDNQTQIQTLAMCRKLEIVAKQLVEHAIS